MRPKKTTRSSLHHHMLVFARSNSRVDLNSRRPGLDIRKAWNLLAPYSGIAQIRTPGRLDVRDHHSALASDLEKLRDRFEPLAHIGTKPAGGIIEDDLHVY